mmetsp:Transcript_6996/g.17108  ORF Transcript_6996/g.17108 Transcript_6996/m.17108 type:complete len:670 (+) Transcript_6996:113-2122(+)|eukprot:CAMPEP_0197178344 /NCGR_PEP_ID=MMETSP1423-20130617/3648_1 /TAXON_ID=476441 /ORGANISM="Pseudo-nitzschia heimii, Strain UNC1101" /LENGTH=669 /DNA_ID=CAMNT_0042628055 /DNA_START=102 /DNA_END=2111 /DNA_ORIENTATION=+
MIKYSKGIFGLNLLTRVHGSAIYRAIIPAITASFVFYGIHAGWEKDPKSELLHPYAAGVLIGGITFLLVFRVTQSYGRYWQATGAVYKMQSKWMDATVHISNYHMQSSLYDDMRPPSYSEHHHLNAHRLTRDRERVRPSRSNLGTMGKFSNRRAQQKSIELVNVDGEVPKIVGMTVLGDDQSHSTDFKMPSVLNSMVKTVVETVEQTTLPKRVLVSRISSRRFESAFAESEGSLESSDENDDENVLRQVDRPPQFLTGQPRTDGNWGRLFDDGNSTYMRPDNLSEIDTSGFASIQGGRTPILFLQELAHLASLLNAVALSTLRNDVEGVASPLSLYIPGSAWPAVDPKWDTNLYDSPLESWVYAMRYFLGQGRSPSERAKYNVARPLPVLGGVSDAEIQMLQMARGPLAKTQLCFGWLSEFALREIGQEAHGALLSRCMQFLSDGMSGYNDCRKIMFNPFPFPFAQISSFFVNFMVVLVPLLMDQYITTTWLGITLSFFSVMCLESIDEVAKELENPFRNIPNELPVVTYQAEFNEALITIYSGFHPDSFWKTPRECRQGSLRREGSLRGSLQRGGSLHNSPLSASYNDINESMSVIREGSSDDSDSEKHQSSGDAAEIQEKMNAQLRMIVDQQSRMMEHMMNEQKRLTTTLEKLIQKNNAQDSQETKE